MAEKENKKIQGLPSPQQISQKTREKKSPEHRAKRITKYESKNEMRTSPRQKTSAY